jgi:hypothetical protein
MPRHNAKERPLPNVLTRICSPRRGCGLSKPHESFGWQVSKPDAVCLDCRRKTNAAYQRKKRPEDPSAVRKANLLRLYRIRLADYDQMRAAQDYRCAACGAHENEIDVSGGVGRPRRDGTRATATPLQVDHCHATGVVRGLLAVQSDHRSGRGAPRSARRVRQVPENERRLTECRLTT